MKKFVAAFLLAAVLSGCSGEIYGNGIDSKARKVMVKDVLLYPELQGKLVTLEGTITTQCMSNGCWFFLQDESGQIFVNLAPKNFSLPAKMGRPAKVTGVIASDSNGYQIVAEGVEVR